MTQTERLTRGQRAETELQMTDGAFKKLRQHLLEAIAATPFEQRDAREALYMSIQLLEPVQAMLREIINDGALARSEIQIAQHLQAAAEGKTVQ